MANGFEYLARSMAPDIVGSFRKGQDRATQVEREKLADQELRAKLGRENQLRQLAPRAYTASTPEEQQQYLSEVAALDPQAAAQSEKQFGSQEDRRKQYVGEMATVLTKLPEQQRAAQYQKMVPLLRQLGLQAPDQYTPDVEQTVQAVARAFQGSQKGPISVSAGETLIDPNTGKPMYTAAAAPSKPMDALGQLEADRRAGLISDQDFAARRQMLTTRDGSASQQQFQTLAPEEVKAAGLPEGTIAQRDARGKISILKKPDAAGGGVKLTEGDKRARITYDSVLNAEKDIASMTGDDTSSGLQAALGSNALTRGMQSDDYRKYEAAAQRWASNLLYLKSGATATPEEINSTRKQFIPMYGDSAEVKKQKAASRRQEIESVANAYGLDKSQIPGGSHGQPSAQAGGNQRPAGEVMATGPNGQKLVLRGGQWQPLQ